MTWESALLLAGWNISQWKRSIPCWEFPLTKSTEWPDPLDQQSRAREDTAPRKRHSRHLALLLGFCFLWENEVWGLWKHCISLQRKVVGVLINMILIQHFPRQIILNDDPQIIFNTLLFTTHWPPNTHFSSLSRAKCGPMTHFQPWKTSANLLGVCSGAIFALLMKTKNVDPLNPPK